MHKFLKIILIKNWYIKYKDFHDIPPHHLLHSLQAGIGICDFVPFFFWLHSFQLQKPINQNSFSLIFYMGSSTSDSPRGNEVIAFGASPLCP